MAQRAAWVQGSFFRFRLGPKIGPIPGQGGLVFTIHFLSWHGMIGGTTLGSMGRLLRAQMVDGVCPVTSRGLQRRAIVRGSRSRLRGHRDAPSVAVYLSRRLSTASVAEIGAQLGSVGPSGVAQTVPRLDVRRWRDRLPAHT